MTDRDSGHQGKLGYGKATLNTGAIPEVTSLPAWTPPGDTLLSMLKPYSTFRHPRSQT